MKSGSANGYIPSLDGFRAISIGIVFLGHSLRNLPIPGGLGVTIFFFISGYLITTLLIREFAKTGTFDFKGFYVRRLLRLMPPLLITMMIGSVLILSGWAEGSLDPLVLVSQVFFFYNYWDVHHVNDAISGLGILWSLSVEEHFYLIFPAIFLISLKNRWSSTWIVGFAVLMLVWRTVKFTTLGADEWTIYALTDTRIDSILWGCFLAIWLDSSAPVAQSSRSQVRFLAFLAGCAVIGLTLIIRDDLFRSTIRYTLQGVALIPIFHYAMTSEGGLVYRVLNNAVIRRVGVYSYTFYLVHYVVLNALNFNNVFGSMVVTAAVAGIISLGYAAAMHEFVELPIKRMRQRGARGAASFLHVERGQ